MIVSNIRRNCQSIWDFTSIEESLVLTSFFIWEDFLDVVSLCLWDPVMFESCCKNVRCEWCLKFSWMSLIASQSYGSITLLYSKIKLKYTIDEYDYFLSFCGRWIQIWQQFPSINSKVGCTGSRNSCICIENWQKVLSKSGLSLYFGCFLMYFWVRNLKNQNLPILPIFWYIGGFHL